MRPPIDSIASLAKFIASPDCKSIAILTGAGVSVASGIPDFRSPGGMYDTLQPHLISCSNDFERKLLESDPTYVVSWDVFEKNPYPYLEVRRPFILGSQQNKWKATIAHRFAELLYTKTHKLTRVYTQNIDGLDRQCTDIPPEKIVNVHGSISKAECEGCGADMAFDDFCKGVEEGIKDIYNVDANAPTESISPIVCKSCKKPLVKPSTILFGRSLPQEFFIRADEDMPSLDLLIIAGTSLVVSPANMLVYKTPAAMRVVINMEQVGLDLGIEYGEDAKRDLFLPGKCDEIFLKLIQELGWLEGLAEDLLPESSAELVRQAKLGDQSNM